MKKLLTIFLIFILSCSSSNESEKLKEAPILYGYIGSEKVTIYWQLPENVVPYEIQVDLSLNGEQFDFIASLGNIERFDINNLNNDQTYFIRIRYKDEDKKKSEYSNIIDLKPSNGVAEVEAAWSLFSSDPESAYDGFDKVIEYNLDAKSNAFIGRAWSLLKLVDGDKSRVSDLLAIETDFNRVSSVRDAKAGLILLHFLNDNFNQVLTNFITFENLNSYVHEHIPAINNNYLRIHAAIANWFKGNHDKVNSYLNILDPGTTHNLSRDEQIVLLQTLLSNYNKPKK